MKKVLFYTSGVGLGGVERVLLEILKKIDTQKIDLKIALQYENENHYENEIPQNIDYKFMLLKDIIEKTLKIREKKDNISRLKYNFRLIYEKYVIKKIFKKYAEDRDIVIDFKSGDFSKITSLNKKAEKIIWLHTAIKKLNRFEERREKIYANLKQADKIVCICKEMEKELLEEFELDRDKVITIYNGLDFEKIRNMSREVEKLSAEELELISDNYILMVSRLEEKSKDFETLIKAFYKVQEIDENLKLYIVGDGADRESILKKIKERGLEKKVLLLGRKDNPYIWMKNSKILIQSSFFEGFGLVLLEGLILKKKIIATDFKTGAREILSNGKFGKIVPIGDYEKMAEEISNLLKGDKDLDFNLENESFKQFEIGNTVKQIEEILSIKK